MFANQWDKRLEFADPLLIAVLICASQVSDLSRVTPRYFTDFSHGMSVSNIWTLLVGLSLLLEKRIAVLLSAFISIRQFLHHSSISSMLFCSRVIILLTDLVR